MWLKSGKGIGRCDVTRGDRGEVRELAQGY